MSMIACEECHRLVDSDDDPDCFVEVGNMRRLSEMRILCERCRDVYYEKLERQANEGPL